MKVNNVIYWSFHLWVTEYNPYEPAGQKFHNTGSLKNIFMDRNLGALKNEYDAAGEVRGLFYQFGRKDPFPRTSGWSDTPFEWYNASGNNIGSITTGTFPTAISLPNRPLAAIPASLNSPKTFYTNASWSLSAENDSLWDTRGGNKSAFDPCPEGWRVPVQRGGGASDSPWYSHSLTSGSGGYTNGRYDDALGYYPFSGRISSAGTMQSSGIDGYFWTSYRGNDSQGVGLFINGSTSIVDNLIGKNLGISVRCVVDTNYLIATKGAGLFGNNAGVMEDKYK
jgi:uncharacterized protein (TIGR02145 family)